jgi:hypothetical protein
MKAADVILVATTHAITHTRARREASAAGARIHLTRGITEDMLLKGAITADFKALKQTTARVAETLSGADEVRVRSDLGTDVTFKLTGRKVFTLDGFYRKEVGFAGFISGEAPTSPLEGTTNGTIVIDYSMDSIGRLKQPLVFSVKNGKVVSVTGAQEEVNASKDTFREAKTIATLPSLPSGPIPMRGSSASWRKTRNGRYGSLCRRGQHVAGRCCRSGNPPRRRHVKTHRRAGQPEDSGGKWQTDYLTQESSLKRRRRGLSLRRRLETDTRFVVLKRADYPYFFFLSNPYSTTRFSHLALSSARNLPNSLEPIKSSV